MVRNGHRPAEVDKPRLNAPRHGSLGEQVLSHAQAGREVVQDFVPLAQSLEWELGGAYLRLRGNKAFLSDAAPVPFIVNNDGALSRNAADVFFASLVAADKLGQFERDIVVLELGIGVGLFARYFLDCMRDLCRQHKKDYYDRLCYIAADRSERMLQDVLRHGVLADHPGRYCVRQLDALRPEELFAVGQDFHPATPKGRIGILPHNEGRLRAVFLNYMLDCLPAAVRQLCVRTCLARNVRLADYTDLTPQQLRERAKSPDPRVREELLEVYGLFASEYDYQPIPGPPLGLPVLPTFSLRDPKAGADMAKVALALNPTCSAELWNALGDALYEFGRTAEARSAYEKALTVNAADVRARYNLAWVAARERDYPAALGRLAEALALDKTGEYRERLLQKQQEVLARLTQQHQQEYLLLINLVSKYAAEEKTNHRDTEAQRSQHREEGE